MRILFLGGTRFTGSALAKLLSDAKHQVSVASRRMPPGYMKVEAILGERAELLVKLKGREFDIVFDFIAYKDKDVHSVLDAISARRYVLVSTTWLPCFLGLSNAGEEIQDIHFDRLEGIPQITQKYLMGKASAEMAVTKYFAEGRDVCIIRFPVVMGRDDHTKRLHFYRSRLKDGNGLIVDDVIGREIQVVTNIDLARAMKKWTENYCEASQLIWDALPPKRLLWVDFLKSLAEADGSNAVLIAVPLVQLRIEFPEYLEIDPLWREKSIQLSKFNLFKYSGLDTSPLKQWMGDLEAIQITDLSKKMRVKELVFIKKMIAKNK
jgi:hypothetical protein